MIKTFEYLSTVAVGFCLGALFSHVTTPKESLKPTVYNNNTGPASYEADDTQAIIKSAQINDSFMWLSNSGAWFILDPSAERTIRYDANRVKVTVAESSNIVVMVFQLKEETK